MNEPKFTPGPWRFAEERPRQILLKRRHWAVGQVHAPANGVCLVFGEDEANARLIAAVTDLHEVAEDAPVLSKYHGVRGFEQERFIADYEAWSKKKRAALAKAGGGR